MPTIPIAGYHYGYFSAPLFLEISRQNNSISFNDVLSQWPLFYLQYNPNSLFFTNIKNKTKENLVLMGPKV